LCVNVILYFARNKSINFRNKLIFEIKPQI
jgi:hypothetical protein